MASLVDMTVERDVCDFLLESGCIEIIIGTVSTSEDTSGRFSKKPDNVVDQSMKYNEGPQ